MPQSSQSDSTQVTVVPDTLVTTKPDTSGTKYTPAWQDSVAQRQGLREPGHLFPGPKGVDKPVKVGWAALKTGLKKLADWWYGDNKKQNYQGKIESADDDT